MPLKTKEEVEKEYAQMLQRCWVVKNKEKIGYTQEDYKTMQQCNEIVAVQKQLSPYRKSAYIV